MNDNELCEVFGTTLEEVEADIEKYEMGDFTDFTFGEPIEGRPSAKMTASSVKFYDFQLATIDRAADIKGVSRSEFIRRACDLELAALS